MKIHSMFVIFLLTYSVNILGQEQKPAPEWEINFGRSWGRFHQHIEKHVVDSSGSISYLNKRNGTPGTGQISGRDVKEIARLLDLLNLQKAKSIPSSEYNECIRSPHAPTSYFSLTRGGNKYSLSPCREYGYTLNLSVDQKTAYKKLLITLESLFGDEIRKQAK